MILIVDSNIYEFSEKKSKDKSNVTALTGVTLYFFFPLNLFISTQEVIFSPLPQECFSWKLGLMSSENINLGNAIFFKNINLTWKTQFTDLIFPETKSVLFTKGSLNEFVYLNCVDLEKCHFRLKTILRKSLQSVDS